MYHFPLQVDLNYKWLVVRYLFTVIRAVENKTNFFQVLLEYIQGVKKTFRYLKDV